MADAAREAANEEHRSVDTGGRKDSRVVPRTRSELDERQPTSLHGVSKCLRRVPGEACRLDAVGRDETDRGDERVEPLDIRRADVEAEPDSRGNHVRAARLDVELPHRGDGTGDLQGRITHALDLACGRDERVLTADHRRRSGMPRTPVEDELPAGIPDDSGHDSDRHVSFGQHGSLLDVELEERPRKLPASRNARAASDASDFLPAKDHDGARSDALDSLDCRHDAECPVEAAALGDAVEVRADPAGV